MMLILGQNSVETHQAEAANTTNLMKYVGFEGTAPVRIVYQPNNKNITCTFPSLD